METGHVDQFRLKTSIEHMIRQNLQETGKYRRSRQNLVCQIQARLIPVQSDSIHLRLILKLMCLQEQTVEIASQVDHPSSAGLACLILYLATLNCSGVIGTAGAVVVITV